MAIHKIPIARDGQLYSFEPYSGLLLVRPIEGPYVATRQLPAQIQCNLHMNDHPYHLRQTSSQLTTDIRVRPWLKLYAHILVRTCRVSFGLARLFAYFRFRVFNNSSEATLAFRKIFPGQIQQDLCFPRSLFAASTSKKYGVGDVVFIGVFLPTKSMHAWVIEDCIQPDHFDRVWINFQPVAAWHMDERS